MGFAAEWGECRSDYGENFVGAGIGSCEFLLISFLFCWGAVALGRIVAWSVSVVSVC